MAILKRKITDPRAPQEYNSQIAARDAFNLAKSKTLDTEPLDIDALVTSLGIDLRLEVLPNEISGYLKKNNGHWTIGVNSLHHPNRRRFTIAHELGHYFLHRHISDFEDRALFRNSSDRNQLEYEANDFAASLLMPSTNFKIALRQTGDNLRAIAERFGVSELATKFRQDSIRQNFGID
ncbi:ImmA/IrrE family metallo-endopeptidase [Ahrensia kielensis]|uniref:ImmA/IrrE family metallo-endopeptidase n=1 Tax=Ahrensia kielensis TaxID=76980 RepID=A0ABU9T6Y0_9HYPH